MTARQYAAQLRQDVGYAMRLLRRAPGFTAVAIGILALGIGASTAIFTIVDVVLLRPLTFAEPERLTMIGTSAGFRVSAGYLHDWRFESRAFRDMAGWSDVRVNLTARGEPLEVLADRVTPNFFAVLGTPAFLGRTQNPDNQLTIVARTVGEPAAMASAIAEQVRETDPNQPVAEMRTMRDLVSADLAQPRFTMLLLGSFAAAAVLLAAIGLYGVIAVGVTERTREIGVRVALGAQYGDVLRLVMRRGLLLTGTGLAIGIAVALAMVRVMAGLLFGVTPTDPATVLAVAVFLSGVAALATYLPARRAARVDPAVAMKAE